MAIPSQSEMFYILLKLVKDLPEFSRGSAKELVCDHLSLSVPEQNETTSSGARIYESRAGWSVSWLFDAGYIERTGRSKYRITERGKDVLSQNLPLDDFTAQLRKDRLERIAQNEDVNPDSVDIVGEHSVSDNQKSPEEIIDETISTMNDQLSNELMDYILNIKGRQGDTFFERLVTDLIAKMGYGKGHVTSASNDAGIDGVITTDRLGFDPIMIQAKRYSPGNQVGRPEVQAFAGALGAVTRGVFITTSSFSQPAIEYAKSYPHATILLIDGKKLTELMIEYNIGVSDERAVTIKKIDSDYFDL